MLAFSMEVATMVLIVATTFWILIFISKLLTANNTVRNGDDSSINRSNVGLLRGSRNHGINYQEHFLDFDLYAADCQQ